PHAERADRRLRLDERAAHVVVADEPPLVGQARLLRVAERGADPAVGDGTTMSASAGASRASWRPRARREASTFRPKTSLSGRARPPARPWSGRGARRRP